MAAGKDQVRKKRVEERDKLFPDAPGIVFNVNDRETKGYARVPRVVPLVAMLADHYRNESPGKLYQVLWSRDFGEGFIIVPNHRQFAYEAALSKGRAERSWNERIRILIELGLIKTRPQPAGEQHGYILLINPYRAVLRLQESPPTDFAFPSEWLEVFNHICQSFKVDLEKLRQPAPVIPPSPPTTPKL